VAARPARRGARACQPEATVERRGALAAAAAAAVAAAAPQHAEALGFKKKLKKRCGIECVPLDKFSEVEGAPGLLYYDTSPGKGAPVEKGQRVAVHFDVKLGKITFFTSRVGTGVTGGVPYGFDIGTSKLGLVLPALDLGTEGMRVGGQRTLKVPAKYAYGDKGYGEIPPGATTTLDIELLSVKVNPITGQRTGS
jgi:FKBP-type peptidyl-prolyl cis-trans isomerase